MGKGAQPQNLKTTLCCYKNYTEEERREFISQGLGSTTPQLLSFQNHRLPFIASRFKSAAKMCLLVSNRGGASGHTSEEEETSCVDGYWSRTFESG